MNISFNKKYNECFNNIFTSKGLIFWIYLENYGPFSQQVYYSQNFSNQTKWIKNGADISCVLINKKVTYSELKKFLSKQVEDLVIGGENDAYEKINALFLHYEPFLGVQENKKKIKFRIEIESAYEGTYFDSTQQDNLRKVNPYTYKPALGENFEILLKFKVIFEEELNTPVYFYYTITTPRKVELKYKNYFEKTLSPIVFSDKMFCQQQYNFKDVKLFLDEFLLQIEGSSKNEIMLKLSSLLDYPQKKELLKQKVIQDDQEVKKLQVFFH